MIKLHLNDVGLLSCALYRGNVSAILDDRKGVNLGAIYEMVAAQELRAHGHNFYYFDRKKIVEADFLIDDYDNLHFFGDQIRL